MPRCSHRHRRCPMTSIEQIARQYRGIRCNHIAQGLADLLR